MELDNGHACASYSNMPTLSNFTKRLSKDAEGADSLWVLNKQTVVLLSHTLVLNCSKSDWSRRVVMPAVKLGL